MTIAAQISPRGVLRLTLAALALVLGLSVAAAQDDPATAPIARSDAASISATRSTRR